MTKISRHCPLQDPVFLSLQHCHTLPMADEMLSSGDRITVKTQEKYRILVKTFQLLLRAKTPMVLVCFQ